MCAVLTLFLKERAGVRGNDRKCSTGPPPLYSPALRALA
jgi:hypothetical protein